MTETDLREKIARLPIKAEWKANLLSGTHLLHWYPDAVIPEDEYVIFLWLRSDIGYSLTCRMHEEGYMNGYSMLNGERTGFLISEQPGSNAYWYDQLDAFIREEELDLEQIT